MLRESLTTLRSVHLLIVGVVAATLLFSLSSNPKQIAYQQIQQLENLSEASINYSDYREAVREISKKHLNKSVCLDAIRKYLHPKNVNITVDEDIRTSSSSGSYTNRISTHAFFVDETLDTISRRMVMPVFVYKADMSSLKRSIEASKFSAIAANSSIRVNAYTNDSYGFYRYPEGHKNIPDEPQWTCTYTLSSDNGLSYIHVKFNLEEQDIEIKSWAHWLDNQSNINSLVKLRNDKYITFPLLQKNWYEFGPLTYDKVDQRLKDKLKNNQDALQVFGFNIAPSSALFVSPLLMLLGLLYFTSHASHVLCITHGDEEVLRGFPWVALYKDKTGMLLTYLSLGVMPVVSLMILLWNTVTSNQVIYLIAFVLTVLVALTGCYAIIIVYRLRRVAFNKV